MGRVLAASVLQVCDTAREMEADTIVSGIKTVFIPSNPDPEKLEEAKRVTELYRAGKEKEMRAFSSMSFPEALRIVRLENGPDQFELHLTAVGIGDFVFAGLPGEPFVEIGMRIIADSPFAATAIMALTDGGEIYFPTGDIYTEGGYEAKSSPIQKGADEILVHGMNALLKEIRSMKEI